MVRYRDKVREAAEDPEIRKLLKDLQKPPKSKIALFIDRDIPASVVEGIRSVPDVLKIVGIATSTMSDPDVWREAKRLRAIIITKDVGFWNDRKYPLKQSPGVVIARGQSSESVAKALALFIVAVDFVDANRRIPGFFAQTKYKVSVAGYAEKLLDYRSQKQTETVEY